MTLTERPANWVPSLSTFATRLKALRDDLGMTVEEIAELCGLNDATWSTWERGTKPRDMDEVVRAISAATKCSAAWLMWGEEGRVISHSVIQPSLWDSLESVPVSPPLSHAA